MKKRPSKKRKAHVERGWAVIVEWRKSSRIMLAWEAGETGASCGFPRCVFDNRKAALAARSRFADDNYQVKSARVVRVEVHELPRTKKRNAPNPRTRRG